MPATFVTRRTRKLQRVLRSDTVDCDSALSFENLLMSILGIIIGVMFLIGSIFFLPKLPQSLLYTGDYLFIIASLLNACTAGIASYECYLHMKHAVHEKEELDKVEEKHKVTCPECGADVSKTDVVFCSHCGAELPEVVMYSSDFLELDDDEFDEPHEKENWKSQRFFINKKGVLCSGSIATENVTILFDGKCVADLHIQKLRVDETCHPFALSIGFQPSENPDEDPNPTYLASKDLQQVHAFIEKCNSFKGFEDEEEEVLAKEDELKEHIQKERHELMESVYYLASSVVFAIGSVLFYPRLFSSPELHELAEEFGAWFFIIGSSGFVMASYRNALAMAAERAHKHQHEDKREELVSEIAAWELWFCLVGSVCFVVGSFLYRPSYRSSSCPPSPAALPTVEGIRRRLRGHHVLTPDLAVATSGSSALCSNLRAGRASYDYGDVMFEGTCLYIIGSVLFTIQGVLHLIRTIVARKNEANAAVVRSSIHCGSVDHGHSTMQHHGGHHQHESLMKNPRATRRGAVMDFGHQASERPASPPESYERTSPEPDERTSSESDGRTSPVPTSSEIQGQTPPQLDAQIFSEPHDQKASDS